MGVIQNEFDKDWGSGRKEIVFRARVEVIINLLTGFTVNKKIVFSKTGCLMFYPY